MCVCVRACTHLPMYVYIVGPGFWDGPSREPQCSKEQGSPGAAPPPLSSGTPLGPSHSSAASYQVHPRHGRCPQHPCGGVASFLDGHVMGPPALPAVSPAPGALFGLPPRLRLHPGPGLQFPVFLSVAFFFSSSSFLVGAPPWAVAEVCEICHSF